jgi:uncharacterized repeat protein (TIGR01451 family)
MSNTGKAIVLRAVSTLVVLVALVPLIPASSAAAPLALPEEQPSADPQPPAEAIALGAEGTVQVRVVAPEGTDLSKYGYFVRRRIPDVTGLAVYYGVVTESGLASLRADPYVVDAARIQLQAQAPDTRPDPDVTTRALPSLEETRARLTALRDNPPEPTERPEPTGWWDVAAGGHNAVEAWDYGYTGNGVAVAVNDSGVDMAHPDFWGTEHRYHNVSGDPYYDYFEGWPVALSPISNYLMAFDLEFNGQLTPFNTFLYGISNFADTSATGVGATIDFDSTTYTTSGTAHPLNPVYHIGYHPDWSLQFYVWGNRIAVLVVDEDGDGVYETVYVDLNNNQDFRDDKPVRRDEQWWNNRTQGADELAWWDADLDGYPDVSGGMLYYIADGDHCPPFFDVYFGCDTTGTGFYPAPGNGDLVAFMFVNLYDTDHGQLCASNVIGQGNINGPNPLGEYPDWKPDGMGGMVQGPGRDAELVPVGDIYWGFEQSVEQTWWFQALGYDGVVTGPEYQGGDDALQASSNSFGPWSVYEDGWDEWSRVPTYLNYEVNPFTTYFMSSGNTGPGYGTTGAPQPITAIQVGSSSEYGSSGAFEPLGSLEQMTAGEAASYYSRGPSANNQLVPHLTADGAWGTGAIGLNETGDGWIAWDLWGGTSRSGPVAMGAATLAMQAYRDANMGAWPNWFEVRQVLMQGANYIHNTPMDGGTGYLNAGRSALMAAGDYGVLVTPDYWDVGDFEGQRYPGGFANITEPGQEYAGEIEIENVGPYTATVTVSDTMLELIDVYTYTFTTADIALEDGEFWKPDYLFDIEEIVGGPLPPDTVYATAELMHSFDTYDYGADEVVDSYFRLNGYDWTDLNGDGNLWVDLNGDGVVNWDEIDALEYARFNRAYDDNHYQFLPISDPLNRFHDGVILAIRHRQMSSDVPTTEITLQVVLYRQADWDALDTSDFGGTFDVPPGATASEFVTFTAPAEYGLYQGAIQVDVETMVDDPPWWDDPQTRNVEYTTVVPVHAQVAYQGDLTAEPLAVRFGDVDDAYAPYSNGYVRPIHDWWQGRATGGDWRFFFLNQDTDPSEPGHQTYMVARTAWAGDAPPADIDTFLLGPDLHFSSHNYDGGDLVFGSSYGEPGPLWGPYALRITGASESPLLSGGHWAFDTATGANVDYAVGELNAGLNSFQIHSHRYDGDDFREDYLVDVGYIDAPAFLEWDNYATVPVTLTTNLAFTEDITVTAFGLSPVDLVTEYDQYAPGPSTDSYSACDASYHYTFTVSNLQQLTVIIDNFSDGDDLDLFVMYDFDGNGAYNCATEVIGASGSGSPDPEVVVIDYPPDGTYWVAVDPYAVTSGGEYFDLFITGMEIGDPIRLNNIDAGSFGPGDPITFDVYNKPGTCDDATQTCQGGLVTVWLEGDGFVPLFDIPVNPRYGRIDVSQSSFKWVSDPVSMPGDLLTYNIEIINSSNVTDTIVVTDVLPSGVTLVDATSGYVEAPTGTLVWGSVPVAPSGRRVASADYEWFDISGVGTPHDDPGEWWGYFTYWYGWPDDDQGFFTVTLPFTYTFFGTDYTEAYVDANGEVSFDFWTGYASAFFCDGQIPGYDGCYERIAVLLGDQAGPILGDANSGLLPGGVVYTYHDDAGTPLDDSDDRFIIQWDEWQVSFRAGYVDYPYPDNTYQLILYPDGRARAQYAEINAPPPHFGGPSPADVGVEGPEGLFTLEGQRWHLTPASGLAWEYIPTVSSTLLTVTVEIDEPLDDGLLCNEAYLDDGYGQITWLYDCTEVVQAELEVTKWVSPTMAVAGDSVDFQIVVTNTGPLTTTIHLTDTLDVGLEGPGGQHQITASSSNFGPGYVLGVSYAATITSTEVNDLLCNGVVVDNGFGALYGDSACVLANFVDLDVSKSSWWTDPHPWPGSVITYEVEVYNAGHYTDTAEVIDYLPGELDFGGIVQPAEAGYIAASRTITASFADLGPGASEWLVFTATVKPGLVRGTPVTNTVEVLDPYVEEDDDLFEDWSDNGFAVENADFRGSWKEAPHHVMPGDLFSYAIYVENSGTLSATAVVTDYLPAEVDVDVPSLAPDITYDPVEHMIAWTGWVTAGETVVLDIPVEVLRVPSTLISNEVIIVGGDDVYVTDPLHTWIHSAELYAEKWMETDWGGGDNLEYAWGLPFNYVLMLQNHSLVSTTVDIEDALPDGVLVREPELAPDITYDPVLHTVSWSGVIDAGTAEHIEDITYDPIDISSIGTAISFGDDDEGTESIPIPWEWGFDLLGWWSNEVRVSANGVVGFDGLNAPRDGDGTIPSQNDPNNAVFALYGNQCGADSCTSGTAYWYHDDNMTPEEQWDDRLIIQFDAWEDVTTGFVNTYKVILYADRNRVEVHYDDINATPLVSDTVPYAADVGVENWDGNYGLTWWGTPADGEAWAFVSFEPGMVRLEVPVRGTLAAALADKAVFNAFTATDEWGQVHESNTTKIEFVSAEIDVLKFTESPTVMTDGVITYTVLLRNVGDAGAGGWWGAWAANMLDTLPSDVTYVPGSLEVVSWPAGWMPPICSVASGGGAIECDFEVSPWEGSNEVTFRYAVQVNPGVDIGTLLTNTVVVNDSYGVYTEGYSVVEVIGRYNVYLPMVARD